MLTAKVAVAESTDLALADEQTRLSAVSLKASAAWADATNAVRRFDGPSSHAARAAGIERDAAAAAVARVDAVRREHRLNAADARRQLEDLIGSTVNVSRAPVVRSRPHQPA